MFVYMCVCARLRGRYCCGRLSLSIPNVNKNCVVCAQCCFVRRHRWRLKCNSPSRVSGSLSLVAKSHQFVPACRYRIWLYIARAHTHTHTQHYQCLHWALNCFPCQLLFNRNVCVCMLSRRIRIGSIFCFYHIHSVSVCLTQSYGFFFLAATSFSVCCWRVTDVHLAIECV